MPRHKPHPTTAPAESSHWVEVEEVEEVVAAVVEAGCRKRGW
jgi:hypothetical protein